MMFADRSRNRNRDRAQRAGATTYIAGDPIIANLHRNNFTLENENEHSTSDNESNGRTTPTNEFPNREPGGPQIEGGERGVGNTWIPENTRGRWRPFVPPRLAALEMDLNNTHPPRNAPQVAARDLVAPAAEEGQVGTRTYRPSPLRRRRQAGDLRSQADSQQTGYSSGEESAQSGISAMSTASQRRIAELEREIRFRDNQLQQTEAQLRQLQVEQRVASTPVTDAPGTSSSFSATPVTNPTARSSKLPLAKPTAPDNTKPRGIPSKVTKLPALREERPEELFPRRATDSIYGQEFVSQASLPLGSGNASGVAPTSKAGARPSFASSTQLPSQRSTTTYAEAASATTTNRSSEFNTHSPKEREANWILTARVRFSNCFYLQK